MSRRARLVTIAEAVALLLLAVLIGVAAILADMPGAHAILAVLLFAWTITVAVAFVVTFRGRQLEQLVAGGPLIRRPPRDARLEVPVPSIPASGTDEGRWWRQGASAESRYIRDKQGANREVISFLEVLGEQAHDQDTSVAYTAIVYTAGWPWRRRLALSLALLRPTR